MPTGFKALGNNAVHPGLGCGNGLVNTADLHEHPCSALMGFGDIRLWVAPEQDQHRHRLFETGLDLALLQQGQDDIDPERLVGQQAPDLPADVGCGQPAHAQHAARPGVGHRSRQLRPGHAPTHTNRKDRVLDTQLLTQRRVQPCFCHTPSSQCRAGLWPTARCERSGNHVAAVGADGLADHEVRLFRRQVDGQIGNVLG